MLPRAVLGAPFHVFPTPNPQPCLPEGPNLPGCLHHPAGPAPRRLPAGRPFGPPALGIQDCTHSASKSQTLKPDLPHHMFFRHCSCKIFQNGARRATMQLRLHDHYTLLCNCLCDHRLANQPHHGSNTNTGETRHQSDDLPSRDADFEQAHGHDVGQRYDMT